MQGGCARNDPLLRNQLFFEELSDDLFDTLSDF